MDLLQKDDTLINAASVSPDPDQGCVTTCYYVGWEWDHAHAKPTPKEEVPNEEVAPR